MFTAGGAEWRMVVEIIMMTSARTTVGKSLLVTVTVPQWNLASALVSQFTESGTASSGTSDRARRSATVTEPSSRPEAVGKYCLSAQD